MRPTIKVFGKKIAARRADESRYRTQAVFAKSVKLGVNRLQAIEASEQAGIDPSRIQLFADALGVSVEEFRKEYTVNGQVDTKPGRHRASVAVAWLNNFSKRPKADRESVRDQLSPETCAILAELFGKANPLSRPKSQTERVGDMNGSSVRPTEQKVRPSMLSADQPRPPRG